jgi:TRAP-type C4-dicarboxylate transport system substrate-binding protein
VAVAALSVAPGFAQDKPVLQFSAVFTENDIRAKMMQQIVDAMKDDFTLELYLNATLFAQGTELVALQRGNLQMSNIAPFVIADQIPAWSLLTSAYLFRDAQHLATFFASEDGATMKKMAEDQLGIHILGPTFFGTRQVGLRIDKHIDTPADMAGVNLRMPGGDAWQFLGSTLGANPTAMAISEVYTALQTGAIDGQDNPLPNVKNLKFNEVLKQIVLTSHVIGYDLLVISKSSWDALSPEQQTRLQAAADAALAWSTEQHLAQEAALADEFRAQGIDVYEPDVAAFRTHAQQMYLDSDFAASWPEGMLERIGAL